MIRPFHRLFTTVAALAFASLISPTAAGEAIQAPTSLEGAIIKITAPQGAVSPYRRVIRLGALLPVGEHGQEFHEGLKLPDPLILIDNNEEAIITDLEYSYKPASSCSNTPGAQAYLGFQYNKGQKEDSSQYQFDCDIPFNAIESAEGLPYNIRFTHKDRHGLHGIIQGWEIDAEQDDTPEQKNYEILVTFNNSEQAQTPAEDTAREIANQQENAFSRKNSLNPDFVNWLVRQRMEQIMSSKTGCMSFSGLYAPQIRRQKDRKMISREDMLLTQMTFIEKFPKRSYMIKQVGVLKNSIQITAAFLYIQASSREFSGYIRLSLYINDKGQITEVGEDLNTRQELKLSPGFTPFPYEGPKEFIAVD